MVRVLLIAACLLISDDVSPGAQSLATAERPSNPIAHSESAARNSPLHVIAEKY